MKNFIIPGFDNRPILCDLFLPKNKDATVVIFSHGFKGFKDWGAFNEIASYFQQEGYAFLKFNYSHNGTTVEDPLNFSDLEAFGNNNFSKELYDLNQVINWIEQDLSKKVNIKHLVLLGHSRGGGLSLLKGTSDNRIDKIITWSSVCDFENRLPKEKIDIWKERGVVYAYNGRTNQQMPIYFQFREDYYTNKNKLSIPKAVQKLLKPTLIVHGDLDPTVNIQEGIQLNQWIKSSKLCIVEGADHVFNVKHPFTSIDTFSQELTFVLEKTLEFLNE